MIYRLEKIDGSYYWVEDDLGSSFLSVDKVDIQKALYGSDPVDSEALIFGAEKTAKLSMVSAYRMLNNISYGSNPSQGDLSATPLSPEKIKKFIRWIKYGVVNQMFNEFIGFDVLSRVAKSNSPEIMQWDFHYGTSWNMMMVLIEQVEQAGYSIEVGKDHVKIFYMKKNPVLYRVADSLTDEDPKLATVYTACMHFVETYFSNSIDLMIDHDGFYCPDCDACGSEGCCPATSCKVVECYYGATYLKDYDYSIKLANKIGEVYQLDPTYVKIEKEVFNDVYKIS